MPNRILKESICTSDSVDGLTWFEEVLFYRLIVNCDDYGRFDGRTAVIKNRLFPLKENLTLKNVSAAINNLARAGLVVLYVFEDKPYLYLPGWNEHQTVRAKRSKYPTPDETCKQMISDDFSSNQTNANVPAIQSNPNPIRNPNPNTKPADAFAAFAAGDVELEKALSAYVSMRKSMKKPLAERSKGQICKKLTEYSGGDHSAMIAMLDDAIEHNWLSVYPLKCGAVQKSGSSPALEYTPGDAELAGIERLKLLRDELAKGDEET